MKTYNGFPWKLNVKAPTPARRGALLNGLYHAYTHPNGVLESNSREHLRTFIFQGFGYGEVNVSDNGLPVGYASMGRNKFRASPATNGSARPLR